MFETAADKRVKLQTAYDKVKDQPGDLVEFGVYEGGNVRSMAEFAPDRTVWAFDTFEGMPVEDWRGEESDKPGKWKPKAPPEKLFEGYKNIKVMKGRFVDTTPQVPPETKFLVVNLDCDWGESYRQALDCITPRLASRAWIFLDEYGYPQVKEVVDRWIAAHPQAKLLDGERIEWNG